MHRVRTLRGGNKGVALEMSRTTQPPGTTADVFQLIWDTLVGVLGATASATLVRRAARNAAAKRPDLETLHMLDVTREGMHFRCALPPSWHKEDEAHLDELRYFFQKGLCPLLEELTGGVMIRLLERQAELRRRRFVYHEGEVS
jgi:hypothetical protein